MVVCRCGVLLVLCYDGVVDGGVWLCYDSMVDGGV